jgi:hypothetical protein
MILSRLSKLSTPLIYYIIGCKIDELTYDLEDDNLEELEELDEDD